MIQEQELSERKLKILQAIRIIWRQASRWVPEQFPSTRI